MLVLAGMARNKCTEYEKTRKGFMKVIIRDMETGLYLKGQARWGDTQSEAMEFDNSIAALEFCVAQKIHNVEILLLLGDPRSDVPLRLFPRAVADERLLPPGKRRTLERENIRSVPMPQPVVPSLGRQQDLPLAQARS